MDSIRITKRLGWVPLNFYMNALYCFGASLMDSFVIYPGWRSVSPAAFMLLHQKQSPWIINTLVIPLFITTLLNALLIFVRPIFIPKKLIIISLACMLSNWIISALIQIPAHQFLLWHYNSEVLDRLLWTNYIRVMLQVIQIITVYRMMHIHYFLTR